MSARSSSDPLASVVRRLEQIAADLERGKHFPITRLTMLKRPCSDSAAASRFALHLAASAHRQMVEQAPPSHLEVDRWRELSRRAAEGVESLRAYLMDSPSSEAHDVLRAAYSSLRQAQNEYRDMRWASARTIHSREALVVEDAIACVLRPWESSYWGYKMARDFAERYDPRYGTGLIPASAPFVREIASFWRQETERGRGSPAA